jgi:hypothetical protein
MHTTEWSEVVIPQKHHAILAKFPGVTVVLHGADSMIIKDKADNPLSNRVLEFS